jgi:hypothetical protein
VTASIDLWTRDDTMAVLPYIVAGIALVLAAYRGERRHDVMVQLRRDLQSSENRNRALDKDNRRLRWENSVLRGVTPTPTAHLGIPRRRARRTYRAPAAAPPAWTQPGPDRHFAERTNWPASIDTATHALELHPAPGDDTEPFPFLALEARR